MDPQTNRVMALAAVCQAVELVRLIARQAKTSDELLNVMFNSITIVDAETPMAVYSNNKNLEMGYKVLCDQLGHQRQKDIEVTRYIAGILTLERKLFKKPASLDQLAQRITNLQRQLTHFDLLDDNMVANIASIYTDVVSPLGNRIQVAGSPQFLKVQGNQQKIRALLLAGIRAAVLWRQLGGKRRHLLFSRQAIINVAQQSITSP
ncbi:MAG: high frequency lysogenization protein [Alteromonadaceae bacterium]|jgi:high frequency lysogenization protein